MGAAMSSSMALALAGFCCSIIFIVFVCSRLACALIRRRRARSRRAPPLPQFYPYSVHSVGAAPAAGLDPAAVAAFPTRAFAAAGGGGASDVDSQ
nr:unnamed protein product [Digitaria exilis]